MSRLVKRIPIDAPMDKVWGVLADFGSAARWAPTVEESHSTTDPGNGVGAGRRMTTSSGEIVEEVIVEWDEGRGIAFEVPSGLGSAIGALRETWVVEPSPQGCVVAVNMDYRLKLGLVSPVLDLLIVKRVLRKMLVLNLAGLKYHVETGEIVSHETTGLPVRAVA